MRVLIGGTFEFLHVGHRELIKKAFDIGSEVTIGITADNFKTGVSKSFTERKKIVDEFAQLFKKPYHITEIYDIYGPAITDDFEVIVVSPETLNNARKINVERKKRGMSELKIVEIPMFLADDLLPVSSHRIRSGEIDKFGKRMKIMRVQIGSQNPSKIKAVKKVFSMIFSFEIEYSASVVNTGVPAQPFNQETLRGAINRAKNALGYADYAVGIEAGLFWEDELNNYLDRTYCAIIDKYGYMSMGHSGGFTYPQKVIDMVKSGVEVGVAMEKIFKVHNIKNKMGAIGFLSNGLINRVDFNAQSVLMAMIPRIRGNLYFSSLEDNRIL